MVLGSASRGCNIVLLSIVPLVDLLGLSCFTKACLKSCQHVVIQGTEVKAVPVPCKAIRAYMYLYP